MHAHSSDVYECACREESCRVGKVVGSPNGDVRGVKRLPVDVAYVELLKDGISKSARDQSIAL